MVQFVFGVCKFYVFFSFLLKIARFIDVRTSTCRTKLSLPATTTTTTTTTAASDATGAASQSTAYLTSLALADDGHWLAAGGGQGVVGVWHVPSQRLYSTLACEAPIGAVIFAARGEVRNNNNNNNKYVF